MDPSPSGIVPVLAAVIERDGCYLLARRPSHKRHGGLWEFPGGKFETSEDALMAARRELAEELGVHVTSVGEVQLTVRDPGSRFEVLFVTTLIEGEPLALEHEALAWVQPEDLIQYSLAPSDARFAEQLTRTKTIRG